MPFLTAYVSHSQLPEGLMVRGEPRTWVDGAWVKDEWDAGTDYSKTMMYRSELFEYEWHVLDQSGEVYITQESREDEGEDVGGDDIAENDAQCAILCQGLSTGVLGEPHWGPFLDLEHVVSIDVNDPPDAVTRPSLWTEGTGVAIDIADNDKWTVSTGTSAPYVSRTLKSLYPYRINRLASGYVEGQEYNPDWPYILRRMRAGEDATTYGDDPDWWTAVPVEDVWNWSNYSYLELGIVAPKAGTIVLTLTVQVPSLTDPCYTSAGDRWEEFSWFETERVFNYNIDVVAGANLGLVDLCLPNEHIIPQGEYRLCRVEEVKFSLLEASGSSEQWELYSLKLTEDVG